MKLYIGLLFDTCQIYKQQQNYTWHEFVILIKGDLNLKYGMYARIDPETKTLLLG